MTSLSETAPTRRDSAFERHGFHWRRFLRVAAGAGTAVLALAFLFAAEPGGTAIRGDLGAAASTLGAIPFNAPLARIRATIAPEFPGLAVTVDADRFPVAVAVTLHGLDRAACVAAERRARRLEGKVVVELEGYGAADSCGAKNDMTWRLMP